jgi:hypothetical protein
MGTHPSGPAKIAGTDTTLSAWLKQHPEALGEAVTRRFGADLPYLFKVRRAAPRRASRPRPHGARAACAAPLHRHRTAQGQLQGPRAAHRWREAGAALLTCSCGGTSQQHSAALSQQGRPQQRERARQ